jgi:Polyketide cyclase / dehydrase and lipid transport
MAQQVIEHELTAKAPAATVFALLIDGSTWPTWSPIDSFELVHKGAGDPEGVGAVRVFSTGRVRSRERLVAVEPNQTFSYALISGLAVRDYKAVVRLLPAGDGTSIHWRSTFRGKVPGTGWIYKRQLGKFIGLTVSGLAAAAESAALIDRPGLD